MDDAFFLKYNLKPWTIKPFELLFHAEIHFVKSTDYDKRLALISFDNSIEVSISTYLSLHPSQRNGKNYAKKYVEEKLQNYHTKIDFFVERINELRLPLHTERSEIIFYHEQRNNQYHGADSSAPSTMVLNKIREIAIWAFSVLFEIHNVENLLKDAINESETSLMTIPEKYIKSEVEKIKSEHDESVLIASILGSWDDNNPQDKKVIEEFVNEF
ncbi:hypothetical protein AGMMS50268_06160 [Spirochaetia bacterium]|nr:hypothetical protein AGMMS50268_06160 [Spirochaetia bacterium]